MAKTFDPSQLSPADQLAFRTWQQSLAQYVAENGGGVPAPVTYALAHPEYLQSHPELRRDYELVSGAMLPPSVRDATKDFHPVWGNAKGEGPVGMQKDSGLFNKWETWLQLGLAGAVGGVGAAGALGGAAAPAGAATTGGTAAAGATSAYGPLAGGYGLATTEAAVPASLAAEGTAGAAAGTSKFWSNIFPELVGIGANTAGSIIQSSQASKAAQAQQEAAQKALELQSNIYQQQRSDLAPYRQAGASSLSALTYGLGLDPSKSADTTTPYFQQQAQQQVSQVPQTAQRGPTTQTAPGNYTGGQAVPRSSLASLATDQGGGFANMVSPDGRPARVPQAQVQAALAAGGRLA